MARAENIVFLGVEVKETDLETNSVYNIRVDTMMIQRREGEGEVTELTAKTLPPSTLPAKTSTTQN